jgi:hypothetical protein
MTRLLPLLVLIPSGLPAFGQEPVLVEGAKRAVSYWHSLFRQCGNSWYAVDPSGPNAGSIQMVPELRLQFRTEESSEEQKLNGFQFKATAA